ncbi:MAG: RHS repeat-associated core domain-containing protein, partial [Pseudomonadota bacterium]
MLSRAEFGGDTLSFYYDGGAVRRVVTQKQGKDGRTSGRMGPGRYLSDGTEQVLMAPRKDTSALYHPGSDALTAYAYTPYGDTPAGSPAPDTEYDLAENPFQFAGEYRDPVWGGYYMRARWYDPELPGFISRDPVQNINRYAYGGGNPVMHVDPTGKDFFHSMGWFNHRLNRGTGGGFARFFLAPMMGPLAILSDPKSFWHAIMHNTAGIDVFLALGIVSEGLGGYLDYDAVQDVVAHTRSRRYLYRSVSDAGLGVGQSTAAGAHRGWHHFDWKTFGKGMEMAGGVNVFWRGLMGANVNSGFRSGSHMAQLLDDFHASASDGDTLVFRVKEPLLGSNHSLPNLPVPKDAPLLEALGLGLYHEKLVAVTYQVGTFGDNDTLWVSEVEVNGLERNAQTQTPAAMRTSFNDSTRRFELVGRTSNFRLQDFFENPTGINLDPNDNAGAIGGPFAAGGVNSYNTLWNNCHTHAYYVLKGMGLR